MSGCSEEQLKKVFDKFDTSNDGKLSIGELKNFLTDLGLDAADSAKIAERIVRDTDKNDDDVITFEEFKAALNEQSRQQCELVGSHDGGVTRQDDDDAITIERAVDSELENASLTPEAT